MFELELFEFRMARNLCVHIHTKRKVAKDFFILPTLDNSIPQKTNRMCFNLSTLFGGHSIMLLLIFKFTNGRFCSCGHKWLNLIKNELLWH